MTGVRVGALLTPHCLPDVGAPLLLVLGAAPPLPDPWLWPRLEYQIRARPGFRFRPAWQGRDTLGQSRRSRWQHSSQGPGCRPTGLTGVPWPIRPRVGPGSGQGVPWLCGWWAAQLQGHRFLWVVVARRPGAPWVRALCTDLCPACHFPGKGGASPPELTWGVLVGRRGALLPRNPGPSWAVRPLAGLQGPDLVTGPPPLRGSDGPRGAGPRRCSGWRRSVWGP